MPPFPTSPKQSTWFLVSRMTAVLTLIGCGHSQTEFYPAARVAPTSARETKADAPSEKKSPPQEEDLPPLASWNAGQAGPLQPIYEHISSRLTVLLQHADTSCKPGTTARRAELHQALSPMYALLQETWATLEPKHRELGLLASAVSEHLSAVHAPASSLAVVLSWLGTEAIDELVCTKHSATPDAVASSIALAAVAWATTPERQYQSAFEALSVEWVDARTSANTAWGRQSAAILSLKNLLDRPPGVASDAPAPPPDELMGLQLLAASSTAKSIRVDGLKGLDYSSWGSQWNHRVDGGEFLDLTIMLAAASSNDPLISESVLPVSIPSCMVVPWREVVASEASPGQRASAHLPSIFVSSRCRPHERLEMKVVSSTPGFDRTFFLELDIPRVDLTLADIEINADLPGFSEEAALADGVPAGKAVELFLNIHASDTTKIEIQRLAPVLSVDEEVVSPRVTLSIPGFRALGNSKFRSIDDVDIAIPPESALTSWLKRRPKLNALSNKPDQIWIRTDFVAQIAAAPATRDEKKKNLKPPPPKSKETPPAKRKAAQEAPVATTAPAAPSQEAAPSSAGTAGDDAPAATPVAPPTLVQPDTYRIRRYWPLKLAVSGAKNASAQK